MSYQALIENLSEAEKAAAFAAGNFGTQKFMLESSLELLRRAQAAAEAGDASPVITAQIECLPALIACEHDLVVLAGLALVLAACAGRTDVVAPDTGPGSVVRNAAGQIVGVRGFVVP